MNGENLFHGKFQWVRTPKVLEAMDVKVFRADYKEEVGSTVDAAARFAFNTNRSEQFCYLKK